MSTTQIEHVTLLAGPMEACSLQYRPIFIGELKGMRVAITAWTEKFTLPQTKTERTQTQTQ